MRKLLFVAVVTCLLWFAGDSASRGPGGGAGGGGRPGGGGAPGGFGGAGHTPSFGGGGGGDGGARPSNPSGGARPGFVPQNRPNTQPGNRPDMNPNSRPDFNPGNRPNLNPGNRPDLNPGSRPDFNPANRPDFNPANRPNFNPDNRPNLNPDNRPIINNRPNIGNNVNVGNQVNVNRPYRPTNYPYYHGWYHGGWNYWGRYPVYWGGAAAYGWMLGSGATYVYSNPYYVQSTSGPPPVYDYSQPLPPPPTAPAPTDSGPAPQDQQPAVPADVTQNFDAARAAFKQGDYAKAQQLDDKAVARMPTDPTLHEFRSLCQFAQKNYKDAAATVYPVLASGPGWDWQTMKALYPDVQTYTDQLRALESYQKSNPNSAEASFLLAYHYLVLGYPDAAVKQLQNVVRLLPNDQLSAQLLQGLQKRNTDTPAPQ